MIISYHAAFLGHLAVSNGNYIRLKDFSCDLDIALRSCRGLVGLFMGMMQHVTGSSLTDQFLLFVCKLTGESGSNLVGLTNV